MSTSTSSTGSVGSDRARSGYGQSEYDRPVSRPSTETKASFKTTELFVYIAAVIAVLVASYVVDGGDGHGDYFRADKAWFYVVLLTLGYLGSRGLAKSGSREHYDR